MRTKPMIIFLRGNALWREQLIAALPGAAVGFILVFALRYTTLIPPQRVLASLLPMMFLFGLFSPVPRGIPLAHRARRAAVVSVAFGVALYALMLV